LTDAARTPRRHARRLAKTGLAAVSLLLFLACAGSDDDADARPARTPTLAPTPVASLPGSTPTETAPNPSSTAVPRPTAIRTPSAEEQPSVLDIVIDRAAEDFGVGRGMINVVSHEYQTWPSTALGCPEPGRFYAQIVTTGYQVILAIGDVTAVYHVDETGAAIVRCNDAIEIKP